MLRNQIRDAREQGFTLIELLIVIVVLGILSGIVVLGVSQFRTDAQTGACKATIDNIQIAVDAYETQNGLGTATKDNVVGYINGNKSIPTGITITQDTTNGSTVGGTC